MSILIDGDTRILVQGITGRDGSFHTRQMIADGSRIVAGVTPGRGGSFFDVAATTATIPGTGHNVSERNGASGGVVPVYDSVREAVRRHHIDATVIFVPASAAASAIIEAAEADVPLIIVITEGVPVLEMVAAFDLVRERGLRMIGPNCPGLISPGKCRVGIMPARIHRPGTIGVISRSGTLTYEVVWNLTRSGLGQSTCIGIGGDPIIGTTFVDALSLFEDDPDTAGVVVIGEIGGDEEERAARYVAREMTKPVVGFIAGRTAPPGKRMGHAGAIISGGSGTARVKVAAFEAAGIPVADTPGDIPGLMKRLLSGDAR